MKAIRWLLALCIAFVALPAWGEMVEKDGAYSLSVSGCPWWLQFPKGDYKLKLERHRQDGKADYYMFSNGNFNVSFYIEPVDKCRSSADCRDQYWSNPGPLIKNPQQVKTYDLNGFSIVQFYLPEIKVKEFTIDQMNVSGHIVRDGYWVDMHMSKVLYKDNDMEKLDGFTKSITFRQK